MGCDIHAFIEYKPTDSDEWLDGDIYLKNKDFGSYPNEQEYKKIDFQFEKRNYGLFAVLADIRNDGSIEPISEPRGLPTDISKRLFVERGQWGANAHSASYFTLAELIEQLPNYLNSPLESMLNELKGQYILLFSKGGEFKHADRLRVVFWFDT